VTKGNNGMHASRSRVAGQVPPILRRRWLIALAIGVVLLALYAGALTWLTQRLQTDVQKSIHPLPAAIEDHRAGG
jgi:hypothetical protein